MASNAADIPLEGSSVDAKPNEPTKLLPDPASTDAEDSSGGASGESDMSTEAQILSILAAAGQDVEPDEELQRLEYLLERNELEMVTFTVVFKKEKHNVSWPLDCSVGKLKNHIESLTGVPASLQKIMFKGLAKDEKTLRDLNIVEGSKVMVIGSSLNDVLTMSAPTKTVLQEEEKAAKSTKEPLSEQKNHKKVLEKYGKPDDVPVGIKGCSEPLPDVPLSGMYNKSGGKVRLTFKMEADQLWLGTKERTVKIPMPSIKGVVSEPIKGHEDYHLMGIQLGPTEASNYWVYWVPTQYVEAVKEAILGKWQFF